MKTKQLTICLLLVTSQVFAEDNCIGKDNINLCEKARNAQAELVEDLPMKVGKELVLEKVMSHENKLTLYARLLYNRGNLENLAKKSQYSIATRK